MTPDTLREWKKEIDKGTDEGIREALMRIYERYLCPSHQNDSQRTHFANFITLSQPPEAE